ncbi:MAG: porin [Burkholderiaceae bacterium]|nr:porin [Burkholderiaceae bacterium]
MKYTSIVIAVLSMASSSISYAQSTNTFYGLLDVNVASTDSGFGSKGSFGTSGMAATRLGVKGERALGDDLRAIYTLEAAVAVDTGVTGNGAITNGINNTAASSGGLIGNGGQLFSRQAYFGLQNDMGTLTIGRQYSGSFGAAALGNALGVGLFGYSGSLLPVIGGMPTRLNNSLVYISPTPAGGGFTAQVAYSTGSENNVIGNVAVGTTTTNWDAGKVIDLTLTYAKGPLYAAVSTWSGNNASYVTAGETGLATKQGTQLAASYDFGAAKLYGTYVTGTIQGGNYENVTKTLSSANGWSVSGAVPIGKGKVIASYTSLTDNSSLNKSATMSGLAYTYSLYEKTTLYAAWGQVSNNSNSSYALANGGDLVGNVSAAGVSPSGFMVGLMMTF